MPLFTQSHSQRLFLPVFTLISIFGTLVVNTLSNLFPPKGMNIGEISRQLFGNVLITPAGYAFSIWGVIYIGLIVYGFYQFRSLSRRDSMLRGLNIRLIIACFAQMAWVILFTLKEFTFSVIAILAILMSLASAYLTLSKQRSRNRRWSSRHPQKFIDVPLSIYFAWIALATIVNIACALTAAEWSGWGISPVIWTIVMVIISFLLGLIALLHRHDYAFAGVILWAEIAISLRHLNTLATLPTLPICVTAGICSLILGGFIVTHKPPRRGLL